MTSFHTKASNVDVLYDKQKFDCNTKLIKIIQNFHFIRMVDSVSGTCVSKWFKCSFIFIIRVHIAVKKNTIHFHGISVWILYIFDFTYAQTT